MSISRFIVFTILVLAIETQAFAETGIHKGKLRMGETFTLESPGPKPVLVKIDYAGNLCHGSLDVKWDFAVPSKNRATAKFSTPLNCADGQVFGLTGYAIDFDGNHGLRLRCLKATQDGYCSKAILEDGKEFRLFLMK